MKTLILLRHAKSSWANPGQSDFDRPLNERGRRDAPVMAKRLLDRAVKIDRILYSSAQRTTETMHVFRTVLGIDVAHCSAIKELYHASAERLHKIVSELDDQDQTVLLIGHNPGITEFANALTHVQTDNMPTCAMFGIQLSGLSWREIKERDNQFLFFDYPKLSHSD